MKEIIEKYKDVVVQIATPFSTGTGFFLKEHNLIVTNEHVIRGSKEVVIDGNAFEKTMSNVLFSDPRHDLAFLSLPSQINLQEISLSPRDVSDGDVVLAIGHPMGLKYTFTQGIVSNSSRFMEEKDLNYIQTDAAINPGNSGGPLVNKLGEVVGVNTMIYKDSNNLGFALPANYLKETLLAYMPSHGKVGTRCLSCSNLVFEDTVDSGYCPHCGSKTSIPSELEEYTPTGISRTIESILSDSGYDVKLSRKGPNLWEIERGSAKINIAYYDKKGFIMSDAFLVKLPKQNISAIYEYLLRENNKLEGLTFSVFRHDVVLSLVIYDQHLNKVSGKTLLERLFEKADHYDDVLVNKFGAEWKEDDD